MSEPTAMSAVNALPKPVMSPPQSQWQIAWRHLRRNPLALFGLYVLLSLVMIALAAPILTPIDPTEMDYENILSAPSRQHIFGTDDLGRDIFSRVLWGGRESLRVGLLAVAIAVIGGTIVGMISGYFGGKADMLIQRAQEIITAIPSILLILSILAVFGVGLNTALVALGIVSIPWFSRIARGATLAVKSMEYISAAQALGANHTRILVLHVLPNIAAPLISAATLALGYAIMAAAGLSYIGLGAQPPSPEWGAMLNAGSGYLRDAWWMSIFPGLFLFFTVLSINLLGDGLVVALDPKLRQ
jgi:peptide/nickel transport system permease protein